MILQLDFASEIPIYQQLRQAIVAAIAAGELKNGDSLPPVRQLAMEIGINMHTVNKAYALLRQDGYLEMNRRQGTIVRERPAADDAFDARLEALLRTAAAEAKGHGLDRAAFLERCERQFDQL